MQCFNDEGKGARPGECKGEFDGVGEAWVRADGLRHVEGVGSQHWGDSTAIGTWGLRGHTGLVVLQADPKESLALALLQALRAGHPTTAAVHVPYRTFLIDELLQLQLEEPGARDLCQEGRDEEQAECAVGSHGWM